MKTNKQVLREHTSGIYCFKGNADLDHLRSSILNAMEEYADQFKPKWISVDERKTLCYKTGDFHGMNSDFVLFINKQGLIFEGVLNEGILDGGYFSDWYKNDEYLVENVTHWMPLPEKPKTETI